MWPLSGNLKELRKPNWKTKKEGRRAMYQAFLVFLVLSIIVIIWSDADEDD
jgi:hypothetical protein